MVSSKPLDSRDLFCVSDNREIFNDNREIRFIAEVKKVAIITIRQEAIILFREKLKTPFRINPNKKGARHRTEIISA